MTKLTRQDKLQGFAEAIAKHLSAIDAGVETLSGGERLPNKFWPGVHEQLPGELKTVWGIRTLTMEYKRRKVDILPMVSALLESPGTPEPMLTTTDNTDNSDPPADTGISLDERLDAMERRLLGVINDEVRHALEAIRGDVQVNDADDEPPLPRKTGKAYHGEKRHVHVMIDKVLSEQAEALAEQRYGGNLSKTFQVILWRAFNRPELSDQGPLISR